MLTKPQFLRAAALIGELWPRQDWPKETVAAAFEMFESLSAKSIESAIRELSAQGREFAPPPGVVFAWAKPDELPALPAPDTIRALTPEERDRAKSLAAAIRKLLVKKGMA